MLEHGGDLGLAAAQYNIPLEDWLDLSTGINPDNYPIAEIPASAWQKLPNDNDGLIEAALAYYDCQFALPTAGSQAALQVLPQLRLPCKVAMLNPMYKEHANAWQRHGHQVTTFSSLEDTEVINAADVVLLCNPNNPTATKFLSNDLLNLHGELVKRGGWLIVDEAFMDATPQHSLAQHAHLDGLFILRSLGKFFGLAGARVGFLLAAQTQLNKLQEALGPWTINGPSRVIAQQALNNTIWQQKARVQLAENSQRLTILLMRYGLTPHAGTALFQYVPTNAAQAWQRHLSKDGIWVRLFSEIPALRFGLPSSDGWDRLENALKKY
jgi:cobalamin biosynthetic protein CobC